MTITLTKSDIRKGIRGMAGGCPIARALKRLGCFNPVVGKTFACWGAPNAFYQAELPEPARAFLRCFDNSRRVTPIEFALQPKQIKFEGYIRKEKGLV